MAGAPELYVNWINQHVGFNPRGQGHSDFLTARIVDDLRSRCSLFGEQFDSGSLKLLSNVGANVKRHMSPLVELDAEAGDEQEIDPNIDGVILRTRDAATMTTPLVIENKTIMTAHGKARTNRYNDARAYASHVHNTRPNTITAFTIVINTALSYRNPDAFARTAKASGVNKAADAQRTIELFKSMRLRNAPSDPPGRCEAVLILAIDYDGMNPTARLVTDSPAPEPSSPFSYHEFLRRLCELYQSRLINSPE